MKTIIIDGVEYNLTPKVAFCEGDWVIDKQGIVHQIANVIENVTCHTYGYDIVGGGYFNDNTEGVRPWTIQDAKDGDILVCGKDKRPFIFKDLLDKFHPNNPVAYCGIDCSNEFFISIGTIWWTDEEVEPATKEQRDLLFQKMKESDYEWDTEKKKLKKIEQKPAWSEEGERILVEMLKIFNIEKFEGYNIGENNEDALKFLKSLKVQPKQEWSEEDEVKINRIVACLENLNVADNDILLKDVDWLKSLRPQNRWKPSDEQMKQLQKYCPGNRPITQLYQDLKKLKG